MKRRHGDEKAIPAGAYLLIGVDGWLCQNSGCAASIAIKNRDGGAYRRVVSRSVASLVFLRDGNGQHNDEAALKQYFKAGVTVHIDPHAPTLQAWDLSSPPAFKGRFAKATIKTRTPVPQANPANDVTTKITLADHAGLPKLTIDQLIWQ